MRGSSSALAAAAVLTNLVLSQPATTQTTGTIDLGVSTVRYEDFLTSGAAHASASLRLDQPRFSLLGRGTLLAYESGSQVLHGAFAGTVFTPRFGRFRGEVTASSSVSAYEDLPQYGHITGASRLHAIGIGRGAWVEPAIGLTFLSGTTQSVWQVSTGAWARYADLNFGASISGTWVGDTAYGDADGILQWRGSQIELRASGGVRFAAREIGRGFYGEASVTYAISSQLGVLLAGGQYPSDPARGFISGRFLSLGVRITAFRTAAPTPPPLARLLRAYPPEARGRSSPSTARLEIVASTGDIRTIRVHVARAHSVELAGDFTDWRPVELDPRGQDMWEIDMPIGTGAHRLNLRVDGGEWIAPRGTRPVEGDFGTAVGILIVW